MSFVNVFGGTVIYPSDVSLIAYELDDDIVLRWPLDAMSGPDVTARIIDLTTTGSGFSVTLPPADETGVGQTILFNNLGPDDVDVLDNDGGTILAISAGEQWQIYLSDNSTAAGTWQTFRYGASTAQAQASALAGEGLVAIGSYLAQAVETSTISSTPYTLTGTDRAAFYVWTGALGTINLLAAATAGNNWFVNVRNGGTGDLTLEPSGAETINDQSNITLQPGDSAVVVTDGIEWWTIGLGKQAIFAFDYTIIDVDGLSGTYTLSGSELNRISYKFTGALANDLTVVVPATLQQYWVNNATTGGYVFSLKADGGATTTNVDEGTRGIYYCDGSEVIKADTTSGVPLPLAVADGGTGSTSAAGARTNLSAAKSGANSDITSLTGLTTPLSVAQGGTGSATAAGARTNLGAAASGANTDITSMAGLGAGSAAAPSIVKSGDTNTGVYWPAADQIGLAAGGVAVLQLGSAAGSQVIIGNASGGSSSAVAIGDTADGGGPECIAIGGGANAGGDGGGAGRNIVIGQSSACASGVNQSTAVGYSAAVSGTSFNSTSLGAQASTSTDNTITLGNSSIATLRCQVTSITALSDERDKTNIRVLPAGMDLEFINALRPVAFDWNMRDGGKVGIPDIGFIAQELLSAQEHIGVSIPNLVFDADPERLEAAYGVLIPILVRSIQQLSDMLDREKAERQQLEQRVTALENYVF